jgi:hypothetical protein
MAIVPPPDLIIVALDSWTLASRKVLGKGFLIAAKAGSPRRLARGERLLRLTAISLLSGKMLILIY